MPAPGGVLIRDADGTVIGGVGISSDHPDRDEDCAAFAIEHGGLVADPGASHDQPAR